MMNSSSWTYEETTILLSLFGANYRQIKCRRSNSKEWNRIAEKFNPLVAHCSLGPRTGCQCKTRINNLMAEYKRKKDRHSNSFPYHDILKEIIDNKGTSFYQCKIRIKNLMVEYKRKKDRHSNSFPYHDILKEIIDNKGTSFNQDDVARINTPLELYDAAAAAEEESSTEESQLEEATLLYSPATKRKPTKNLRLVNKHEYFRKQEYLEDSLKRREHLLEGIQQRLLEMQHQYQQFTLDVLKKIGEIQQKGAIQSIFKKTQCK